MVRHHRAADRLGGGTWPPADDERGVAGLVEDVPDGLGFSREIRDRPHGARLRIGLGEAVDAVLIRSLAGGDAGPEHRRQGRLKRGEVAHHAGLDQPTDMGHQPHVHERRDHFPVGGIPADEQHATFSDHVIACPANGVRPTRWRRLRQPLRGGADGVRAWRANPSRARARCRPTPGRSPERRRHLCHRR